MPVPDDYPFDASSPVGRYWLVHGVGFTVCGSDGRELGMVEEVVVDRVRHCAEQVIVRRPGLFVRRRSVTLHASAVQAVAPASRRFVVGPAPSRASAASRAAEAARPVGRAIRRGGGASRPLIAKLLRRLAAGLTVAGRLSRDGASAAARATAAAAGRARREAPRLASWIAARSRTAGRATLTMLRFLGRAGLATARHLGAGARIAARVLGDLAVLAAVLAAAAWRRATTLTPRDAAPPQEDGREDAPQWRNDADAPLSRETSDAVPTQRTVRRSAPSAGRDRRSGR